MLKRKAGASGLIAAIMFSIGWASSPTPAHAQGVLPTPLAGISNEGFNNESQRQYAFISGRYVQAAVSHAGILHSSFNAMDQLGENNGFSSIDPSITLGVKTLLNRDAKWDDPSPIVRGPIAYAFDGWGLQVGESVATQREDRTPLEGDTGYPRLITSSVSDASGSRYNEYSANWRSASDYQGIRVSQEFTVPTYGQRVDVDVTLSNVSGTTLRDVYFTRAAIQPGSKVSSQAPDNGYSLALAEGSDDSVLGLYSSDARSRVAISSRSLFPAAFSETWNGTGNFNGEIDDSTGSYMFLTFKIDEIPRNGSTTLSFSYLLSDEEVLDKTDTTVWAPVITALDQSATINLSALPYTKDPITGYRIGQISSDGVTTFGPVVSSLPQTITGLTNGTGYRFSVSVIAGRSEFSLFEGFTDYSEFVTPGLPLAPTITSLSSSDKKVGVSFQAPSSTGGLTITDYEYSTDNGATWSSAGTTTSPFEITAQSGGVQGNLENGLLYDIKIRAVNSERSGLASEARAATPATVPTPPVISRVARGIQSLEVALSAQSNGGSAITNFEYSTDGTNYRAFSPPQTTSPLTITTLSTDGTTQLVDGRSYPVTLKAINAKGTSGASNSVSAATVTVPIAPRIDSVAASDRSVRLSLDSRGDGGSAITNYEYSTDGSTYLRFSPAQTGPDLRIDYLSSDGNVRLTNGQNYRISVKAVNARGTSEPSESVEATPVGSVNSASSQRPESSNSTSSSESQPPPPTAPQRLIPPRGPGNTSLSTENTSPNQPAGPSGNSARPVAPRLPTVSVQGLEVPAEITSPSFRELSITAGATSFSLTLPSSEDRIESSPDGPTEVSVRKGSSTSLRGDGLAPGSVVNVFLPLEGNRTAEIARLEVNGDGEFESTATFANRANEPPLPIGRNVLRLVGLDEDGNEVVVELAVNVAQGLPEPEINRESGSTPSLEPGEAFALSGGIPLEVEFVSEPTNGLALLVGPDWSMNIEIPADSAPANDSPGAGLAIRRDDALSLAGSGFLPGSRADVWLFSYPVLLGSGTVDDNGDFSFDVLIDSRVVPIGDHTLQIQGVGNDGYVKAAGVGISIRESNDSSGLLPTTSTQSLLGWITLAGGFLIVLFGLFFWIAVFKKRKVG